MATAGVVVLGTALLQGRLNDEVLGAAALGEPTCWSWAGRVTSRAATARM